MGRLGLLIGLALILLPILVVSMLADLTRKQAIMVFVCAVLVAGAVGFYNTEAFTGLWWHWMAPKAPADQEQFVAAVEDLRKSADEPQDTQRLEMLRDKLCDTPDEVADWAGIVANAFDSPSGRKRVVVVNIAPHIVLRTALSDDGTGTLIGVASAAFPTADGLASGDVVMLSGSFVKDAGSCRGPAVTRDALLEPNFIFRFSALQKHAAE